MRGLFGGSWIIGAAALFGAAALSPAEAALGPEEAAIAARVEANFDDSLAFLERIVNINSDTMNHEGVKANADIFAEAFAAIGFDTEWEALPRELDRAGHLHARLKGRRGARLLLIGHLDTVFAKDGDFQTFRREGERAYGPGVADMKGGNVVVLYALRALKEAGHLDGARIHVLFTGEEEKPGQPISVSRKSMVKAAKAADAALNFEGGEEGIVVTSRRGSSSWRLTTTGVRAHSSGIFSERVGAGAVFEAARILNAFYEALGGEDYLTFNPGVIVGGTDVSYDPPNSRGTVFGKTNVVAQKTVVDGGLRFISEEQKERARAAMREIVAEHLPQTGAEIEFQDSYPAMSPTAGNEKLRKIASAVSEDLGFGPLAANDPSKRGAADISFAAPHAGASMDGLGVLGGGAHSPEEYMEVASLKDATLRAAILLYRLTRDDKGGL